MVEKCSRCSHAKHRNQDCLNCAKQRVLKIKKELKNHDVKIMSDKVVRKVVKDFSKFMENDPTYCKRCESYWPIKQIEGHQCKIFKMVNGERQYI